VARDRGGAHTGGAVEPDRLLRIVVALATRLSADFTVQEVLDHLTVGVRELLSVEGAGVLWVEEGPGHRIVATSDERVRHAEDLQLQVGEGPCLTAFEDGVSVTLPDLAVEVTAPAFTRYAVAAGLRSVASFPLRHAGRRFGVLELYSAEPLHLDEAQLAGVQTLVDVAASYVLIAQRRDAVAVSTAELAVAALHDPLTGLPNRRLLADRLEHATRRARRSGSPFGVIFGDVDDFKGINDRHGHLVGDRVLVEIAARVQGSLRPGDTLARVSGDEFVLLCEELPGLAEAEEVAARAVAALRAPFEVDADRPLEVRLSFGIALAGPEHGSPEEALVRADAAMYRAKRLRRGPQVAATSSRGSAPEGARSAD
jgi:diguanylate cyclase (GGDEF)-like protein